MIIDVANGHGVGAHVKCSLVDHMKKMCIILICLLNVASDNGLDVISAVKHIFQLINAAIGYEQMCKCNHVWCADDSVQLGVLKVLAPIKDINR